MPARFFQRSIQLFFDDVILGANSYYTGNAGYVVFGKASGFNASLDLSSLDGSNGFILNWDIGSLGPNFFSVSSAGDVNGDGFDDVIAGGVNRGGYGGMSRVLLGKASFDARMEGDFNLDEVYGDYIGASVSDAGDVNGDGFDDVIVGGPLAERNGDKSGSSYVVFGKASGFSASMNLSSLDGNNGFRLDGVAADDFSGASVSNAGDVNGDGFDDLIIGAFHADPNGENSGSSYLVFGRAAGFGAAINLSHLDSNTGVRLDGVAAGDLSDYSVSGAGDVNGDGFDDLLIGARTADINGNHSGASYVLFGRSNFGSEVVHQGTPDDDNLKGTAAAERFEGNEGNDLLIGRGGADVFHGGTGNDRMRVLDLNFQLVDGGAGNDVLSLCGEGQSLILDLANVQGKITGIEAIYMYGTDDDTLTVSAADVLNLSDTSNTLKVKGDTGDRVIIHGEWTDGGIHGIFHTYTSDAAASDNVAVLMVGVNLTVDFA